MSINTSNYFSNDIREWAYINFRLQLMLCQKTPFNSKRVKKDLDMIGYEGICPDALNTMQKEELLETDAFFGYMQTGHRIITFALKKNGLNREMFDNIHKSIHTAYQEIIQEYEPNELIETSYKHCLQTLSVFRP